MSLLNTTCAEKLAAGNLTEAWLCPYTQALTPEGGMLFTGTQMLMLLTYTSTLGFVYMKTGNLTLVAIIGILMFAEITAYSFNLLPAITQNPIALIITLILTLLIVWVIAGRRN